MKNSFSEYLAFAVCAELMVFAGNNIRQFRNPNGILKDLGIDCYHITRNIDNIEKAFIKISNEQTTSMYLMHDGSIKGHIYPDKDSIYITCIEDIYSGHGCKWVTIDYNDIMSESAEWLSKNKK